MEEIQQLTEDEFWDTYEPLENNNEPIWQYLDTKKYPITRVWTIVTGDDNETLVAIPGYHYVNRIGYAVTRKAWDTTLIEGIWSDPIDREE